ncbi:MAG TPA: DNA polymerase III subunit alpha, partial [Balneolaceae bacterium]|nr:DNA polymerase III subunit alpha [Balneolaceae bacterium]
MYLIFDTETTGLPRDYSAPITDFDNWPRLVQLAWQLHDETGKLVSSGNYIVKPVGFTIPFNSEKIHGISTQRALDEGHDLVFVLNEFRKDMDKAYFLIGHNVSFDEKVMGAEFLREKIPSAIIDKPKIDTKDEGTEYCAIPNGRGGYKWPTLTELHKKLFGRDFEDAHDAAADVEATARCFLELVYLGIIKVNFPLDAKLYEHSQSYMVRENYIDLVSPSRFKKKDDEIVEEDDSGIEVDDQLHKLDENVVFTHLHCHSKYSVLQATAGVKELVAKAKELGMPAVALTDLGNMYGAFAFAAEAHRQEITPILGCELYVVDDRHQKKFTRENRDRRYQIPILAKNQNGYKNLAKICSVGFTEGYYYKFPRVDKEVIKEHSEDLICLSGGIRGMLADLVLNKGEQFAEEELQWWIEVFGDDFYLEVINHGLDEEKRVNEVFKHFSEKYGVKLVASNNCFYIDKEDADAHDALICIDDGTLKSTPIGRGREFRYGFPNQEFYFKDTDDMKVLFADMPEAIANTQEIVDKIEPVELERDVILPKFHIPEGFNGENDYLRHLTYEGAKTRYPEMDEAIKQRIEHELKIIKDMGFPGYFLIVQDFIAAARDMGVYVGPGRGSAAGSVVAYCTGITNIDPLKYDLLFERFLNPERISMPDIDIDFDDDGRQRVIEYVVDKYGKNQVAHIITFGSMAARSSVRDVARVLDLPLSDADRIAKLVPERPGTSLDDAFAEVPELREIRDGEGLEAETLKMAYVLEGSVRNTGIHAAGIIIAPDDLTEYIPVSTAKDADLQVTQFDGSVIESAGMLKMDFLGLKTLSILKTAIGYVKENYGKEYDLDDIPLDDEKTYKLYQKGGTLGTFQFESEGMRKYLKELKPTNINDLIAMNALYRPGPMQFIPDYINRKQGIEEAEYDHELVRDILEPTFGIMIYQEQIMNVAQKLAGYSLGGADLLRRAMGKKKHDVMEKEKPKFVEGAKNNGVDEKTALSIFEKMQMFASYGFNKSHSAAYSVVAYHTMYFKANYPAEYMAAVMSHNMNDIKKVASFIEECQKMGIEVDPPNINTARGKFVAKEGRVQYGMSAIKGVGSSAIAHIVEEREENGLFKSVFDFASRIDSRICNRRTLESLIQAGAFDELEENRAMLLMGVEDILSYAARKQEEKRLNQVNLFGGSGGGGVLQEPKLKPVERWSSIERLNKERELIGFYLSGHPLNRFKEDLSLFGKQNLSDECINQLQHDSELRFIAIITSKRVASDKKGRPIAFLMVEDLYSSMEIAVFSKQFDQFAPLLEVDNVVYISGRYTKRERGNSLIVNNIERVENLRENFQSKLRLHINIHTDRVTTDDLVQIETLFGVNK